MKKDNVIALNVEPEIPNINAATFEKLAKINYRTLWARRVEHEFLHYDSTLETIALGALVAGIYKQDMEAYDELMQILRNAVVQGITRIEQEAIPTYLRGYASHPTPVSQIARLHVSWT